MKIISTLIAFLILFSFVKAQAQENFDWQGVSSGISASIKYKTTGKAKPKNCLLFFATSDSLADVFLPAADSFPNFQTVRVIFSCNPDSLNPLHLKGFANDIVKDLLPLLKKKEHSLPAGNIIVAGINAGAVMALYCAAIDPAKIDKTGMFVTGENFFSKLKMQEDSLLAVNGKVFVYQRKENKEDISADDFCDVMGLLQGILIYKTDAENEKNGKIIFKEFLQWIMPEGSNYIISTE